jgi:hypothetical protein
MPNLESQPDKAFLNIRDILTDIAMSKTNGYDRRTRDNFYREKAYNIWLLL